MVYNENDIISNLLRIIEGKVEIIVNGQQKIIDKGTIGEWCLINQKTLETAKTIEDTTFMSISPAELTSLPNRNELIFEIFESITKRLIVVDENLTGDLDYLAAKETFKKLHPTYEYMMNDPFVCKYLEMKKLYIEGKFDEAYNSLISIKTEKLSKSEIEEIDLWKLIITFSLDQPKAISRFHLLNPDIYGKHISYQYLKSIIAGKVNAMQTLYILHGIHVPAHSVIIYEGVSEQDKDGFLLFQGGLKVGRYSKGSETLLSVIEEGEFFGEAGMFNQNFRLATVYTEYSCDIIKMTSDSFKTIINSTPTLGLRLIKSQLNRILFVKEFISMKNQKNKKEQIYSIMNGSIRKFASAGMTLNELSTLCEYPTRDLLNLLKDLNVKVDPTGHIKF